MHLDARREERGVAKATQATSNKADRYIPAQS